MSYDATYGACYCPFSFSFFIFVFLFYSFSVWFGTCVCVCVMLFEQCSFLEFFVRMKSVSRKRSIRASTCIWPKVNKQWLFILYFICIYPKKQLQFSYGFYGFLFALLASLFLVRSIILSSLSGFRFVLRPRAPLWKPYKRTYDIAIYTQRVVER